MGKFSQYIENLFKSCSAVGCDEFEESANEPEYMSNTYSFNNDGELSHLSLVGHDVLDLNQIFLFPSLKYLILRDCQISNIPETIYNLQEVIRIDFADNLIRVLPDSFCQLRNLRELRLTNNKIHQLPNDFGNLYNLIWFFADNNYLNSLPESLSKLSQLDILNLANNKIEKLPNKFGNLNSLVELYLDRNRLKLLPRSMLSMRNIDVLFLTDNKLRVDVDELARMDAADLITFIINSDGNNTELLNEFKLLVVGDERVGKTSLINRILDKDFNFNCSSTHGVDITNGLQFNDYKVNIWDFAGQEVTHQTHQFFLSKRSLYFLVIDAQTEDDSYSIYNWLSTIKTYGGNESPIIIIVNKIDLNKGYIFDKELYDKEFNIKDVIYSSAKQNTFLGTDKKCVADLTKLIIDNSKHIHGLEFRMPQAWLSVKNHIEHESYKNKSIMDLNDFESLCSKYNVLDSRDQRSLLSLLNQIGTVVAYVDDERLNIIQIIDPEWLTTAVYKIIRSEKIEQDGTLNYQILREIFLEDKSYRTHHFRWLMDLLIQFDLAFEINNNTILIPARISKAQPNFSLSSYTKGFGYRFDYHTFLKRNILSQLIVKLNKLIDSDTDKYWKRGVFLNNNLSKAVVILDEFRKSIEISISGTCISSVELRTKIVNTIRDINDNKYDVDEMIAIKDGAEVLDYQSYDFLVDLVDSGYEHHVVSVRDQATRKIKPHKVNIKKMLFGFKDDEWEQFNYIKLTSNIIGSLLLMTESRLVIKNEKENLINTRLRDSLINRGYIVSDQSLGGESESKLSEGERDIVIRCQTGQSKTIIEGLCLTSCSTRIIESHYQKLKYNYDTCGHKFNYLIVYSKSKNFDALTTKYFEYFIKKGECAWLDKLSEDAKKLRILESNIENVPIIHIIVSLK